MKNLLFLISFFLLTTGAQATIIVVDRTNNAGTGSLRAAVALATNGDTIRFNPNLIALGSDSIVLTSEIYFSKSLQFTGLYNSSDTLFVSGGGTNRIFYISSTNKIVLDSMVIVNGSTTGSGGGIYATSVDSLLVFNSKVIHCSAPFDGGGIQMFSPSFNLIPAVAYFELKNSIIANNSASYGAGIFISAPITGTYRGTDYVRINISNSIFKNNYAVNVGGGIYGFCTDSIVVKIDSSVFSNNRAVGISGGGVYSGTHSDSSFSNFSQILVSNSKFLDNWAEDYGGAIYSYNGGGASFTGNLTSEVLVNNTVLSRNGGPDRSGAIYSGASHIVNDTTFSGAIKSTIIVENSTINNSSGRAIHSSVNPVYNSGSASSSYESLVQVKESTIFKNSWFQGSGVSNRIFTPLNNQLGSFSVVTDIKNSSILNNTGLFGKCIENDCNNIAGTSTINIGSSIIALNGPPTIYNNKTPLFISGGYNIFSDSVMTDTVSTDQINIDSTTLNLGLLAFNGGTTPTMMPIFPSAAINNGNPLDSTDAQNVPVVGTRDVGAAEVCLATLDTHAIVSCDSYTWINGVTYTASDSGDVFTMVNAAGCDSVMILNLTINSSSSATDTITTCNQYTWLDGNTLLF